MFWSVRSRGREEIEKLGRARRREERQIDLDCVVIQRCDEVRAAARIDCLPQSNLWPTMQLETEQCVRLE